MKDQIIVHKTPNCYEAEFLGPHSAEVQMLFGTQTIPTPYAPPANAQVVRLALLQRNLGIQVDLCDCCLEAIL